MFDTEFEYSQVIKECFEIFSKKTKEVTNINKSFKDEYLKVFCKNKFNNLFILM